MTLKEYENDDFKAVFVCDSRATRDGFAHDCTLFINRYQETKTSCFYLNRTWEAYQYQSVMLSAARQVIDDRISDIKEEYKRENNLNRIASNKAKADIAALIESDAKLQFLHDVYDDLMKY